MDTKEKILLAALKLFAIDGYEAVSVSMIAGEVGITKGALYKHYENKRDIFDNIVRRMEEKERENALQFNLPENLFENMPESYRGTKIEQLYGYTLAQFVYWTEDSFASLFRKMVSLERYRNAEMNALYQRYLGAGPLIQVEEWMRMLSEAGLMDASPRHMALEFYSPVYTLIGLFDGGGDKAQINAQLKEHMEYFVARLERQTKTIVKSNVADPPYTKSNKYTGYKYMSMLTGPNSLKLTEELLFGHLIKKNATVFNLAGDNGLSSFFLAKEYGFKVYAADLWGELEKSAAFFASEGLGEERLQTAKADNGELPFKEGYFDAVISINAFHYLGRDKHYLNKTLLSYVKHGGYIYIVVPGMVADCHDRLPRELLLSWNPDQLEYLHDISYWRGILSAARGIDILTIQQMESKEDLWWDWLYQGSSNAVNARKAIEAGAGEYLNFIKIVLRKR